MKKILVDLLMALILKIGSYFYREWQKFKKNKATVKEQSKKTQGIEDAELKREIEAAHRRNML